ncbi:MAG: DNA repair protein RecO [Armatimonadota bacterium]|nr:DNA repair protein RecO [Armatimonadota bacterium]
MSLRVYTTAAVVLHRVNLAENDRILRLYTEERGKLSAVAKGSRKPLSKLAGCTETFTHARMQLAVGRNLDVVTQVEICDAFPRTRSDLRRIACASVVTELVDRFTEERDPHPALFALLIGTLRALERGEYPDLHVLGFELALLAQLGYRPHLEDCVVCRGSVREGTLAFSPSLGGVLCSAHCRHAADAVPVGGGTVLLGNALQRLFPQQVAAVEALGTHATSAVKHQLDGMLRAHLQYRLERPLRSLDFLREVQALSAVK